MSPFRNQFHAMASFMSPPPGYQTSQPYNPSYGTSAHPYGGPQYQNNMEYFSPPPGPPPNHNNHFNLVVDPPRGPPPTHVNPSHLAVQPPPPGTPPPRRDVSPQQPQRVFPPSFSLYAKSSLTSILDPDTLKFTLGTDPKNPLYGAKLETDSLQRPKLTLVPAWDRSLPPLGSIKTKGWKDSMITVEPLPGSRNQPQIIETLTLKYGISSRTYTFGVAVPSHGIGKRETFSWVREGHAPSHSSGGKKSRLDGWGLGSLTDMDMGLGDKEEDLSLSAKRELIHDTSGEVVARWIENDGSSMSKTGNFEFIGTGASGAFGPQWEIMAVISALRIWHEDYHASKAVMEALGGA